MKTYSCDLCGQPAVDDRRPISARTPAPNLGTDTVIVAVVIFRIEDHPTGFGGPPDLCEDCRHGLAKAVADAVKPDALAPQEDV